VSLPFVLNLGQLQSRIGFAFVFVFNYHLNSRPQSKFRNCRQVVSDICGYSAARLNKIKTDRYDMIFAPNLKESK